MKKLLNKLEVDIEMSDEGTHIFECLKTLFRKLNNFNDNKPSNAKQTPIKRKRTTSAESSTTLTTICSSTSRSGRVRMKVAIKQQPAESINEPPLKQQKTVKNEKVKKEETLEELFLPEQLDNAYEFKSAINIRVCIKCLNTNDVDTTKCSKKKCNNFCHTWCFDKNEPVLSETLNKDEIKRFCLFCCDFKVCKSCRATIEGNEAFVACKHANCNSNYHVECLKKTTQNELTCPLHHCQSCQHQRFIANNTNTPLVKCIQCLVTYHASVKCVPAGTQVISKTQIICPRHTTKEEQKMKQQPVKINWCVVCTKGGNKNELLACRICPKAFHRHCLAENMNVPVDETSAAEFLCNDCTNGALPTYYSIVWAKVGSYRWWPAFVMIPWTVPLKTLQNKKFYRQFCIRFFGSHDYFITSCEHVFQYEHINEVDFEDKKKVIYYFKTI